jgi:hypothetical protein
MKRESSVGFQFGILQRCFPPWQIARPLDRDLPGILTLPGTVGRGFYMISFGKFSIGKHNGTLDICVLREYPQTENEFFRWLNSKRKPQCGFLRHGSRGA